MRRHSLGIPAVLTCFCLLGCDDEIVDPDGPAIFASEIPSTALPLDLDAARTYGYSGAEPPEDLLRVLWKQGFHPRRAWQPLPGDEECLTWALTPTFTVELDAPDARMLEQDFYQGTDGLYCVRRYMSYQVLD